MYVSYAEIPLVIKESYLSQKNVDDEIDETSPVLGKHLQQQVMKESCYFNVVIFFWLKPYHSLAIVVFFNW